MRRMTSKSFGLPDDVYDYVLAHGVREPEILARLREETAPIRWPRCRSPRTRARSSGSSSSCSARAGAWRSGRSPGYSSLAVALALPDDGRLVCCDVSEEYTSVARRYWAEAGVADQTDLRIGAGDRHARRAARRTGREDTFDLAFIDADKKATPTTTSAASRLVRPGRRGRAGQRPVGRRDRRPGERRTGTRSPCGRSTSSSRDDERVTRGPAAGRGRDDARPQALSLPGRVRRGDGRGKRTSLNRLRSGERPDAVRPSTRASPRRRPR